MQQQSEQAEKNRNGNKSPENNYAQLAVYAHTMIVVKLSKPRCNEDEKIDAYYSMSCSW